MRARRLTAAAARSLTTSGGLLVLDARRVTDQASCISKAAMPDAGNMNQLDASRRFSFRDGLCKRWGAVRRNPRRPARVRDGQAGFAAYRRRDQFNEERRRRRAGREDPLQLAELTLPIPVGFRPVVRLTIRVGGYRRGRERLERMVVERGDQLRVGHETEHHERDETRSSVEPDDMLPTRAQV